MMRELFRASQLMQDDPARTVYYISSDGAVCPAAVGAVGDKIAAQAGNSVQSNVYIGGRGKIIYSKIITSLRIQNVPRLMEIWMPRGEIQILSNNSNDTLYTKIHNTDNITTIGSNMQGWNDTGDLSLPSLTSITGTYQGAFYNCKFRTIRVPSLSTIPNSLSYGRYFVNGAYIHLLDIRSCTSIGTYAIYNCTALDTLILGATIPSVGTGNFGNAPLSNIYVPDNMVDAYKADSYWSAYASAIKPYSDMPSNL